LYVGLGNLTFINERNKSYEFILIDDINVVDNERYTHMLNELRQVSPNRIVYMSQIDLLHECDKEHIGSVMADNSKEIEEEMYRIIAEYKDSDIQVIEGSYGPYIKHAGSNYKIPKGTDPSTLTEENCKEIIASSEPTGRKKRRK
jgi:hypothetical protein